MNQVDEALSNAKYLAIGLTIILAALGLAESFFLLLKLQRGSVLEQPELLRAPLFLVLAVVAWFTRIEIKKASETLVLMRSLASFR